MVLRLRLRLRLRLLILLICILLMPRRSLRVASYGLRIPKLAAAAAAAADLVVPSSHLLVLMLVLVLVPVLVLVLNLVLGRVLGLRCVLLVLRPPGCSDERDRCNDGGGSKMEEP